MKIGGDNYTPRDCEDGSATVFQPDFLSKKLEFLSLDHDVVLVSFVAMKLQSLFYENQILGKR